MGAAVRLADLSEETDTEGRTLLFLSAAMASGVVAAGQQGVCLSAMAATLAGRAISSLDCALTFVFYRDVRGRSAQWALPASKAGYAMTQRVARFIGRGILWYRQEGMGGLLYAVARKMLWRPRDFRRRARLRRAAERAGQALVPAKVLTFEMFVSAQDTGVSAELFSDGMHEPACTYVMCHALSPGMTVVDVGSNLGYYALLEAYLVGEQGRVVAIEPSPNNAAILRKNVEHNQLTNVEVHELAVGETEGTSTLYLFEQSNWLSLLPHKGFTGQVEVPVRRLDDVLAGEPRVDMVRMDIEGYECRVIDGMRRTLAQHRPLLMVELHASLVGPEEVVGFLRTMQTLGYTVGCAVLRARDEVFGRGILAPRGRAIETPSIDDLATDERLIRYGENFSVLFQPAEGSGGPSRGLRPMEELVPSSCRGQVLSLLNGTPAIRP